MPEENELRIIYMLLILWYFAVKDTSPLILLHIWADGADGDMKKGWGKDGHAFPVTANFKAIRGSLHAQKPIYPPLKLLHGADSVEAAQFKLEGIEFNPRNVILNLGRIWLQVQLLTHTVCQIYSHDEWHGQICKVNQQMRGFKVGIALDFGNWIIAFCSLDLVFTPIWAPTRNALRAEHVDVLENWTGWLEAVVEWAKKRLHSKSARDGLAVEAVRDANVVWGGVGTYTVEEIFSKCGVPPTARECEVFDNPSRFARACEGYYAHCKKGKDVLWPKLKPLLRDNYYFAIENEDRLEYSKYLYVHAKDWVRLTERQDVLLTQYKEHFETKSQESEIWIRGPSTCPSDVFEPTLLQLALTKPQNLGVMIFGGRQQWLEVSGGSGAVWEDNPLQRYFDARGIPNSPETTYLRPNYYQPLYLPDLAFCARKAQTYLFRHDKTIWSMVPDYPKNSRPKVDPTRRARASLEVEHVDATARDHLLFTHVVKHSGKAAIGPLDYCAIGIVLKKHQNRKKPIIIPCKNSPLLTPWQANRLDAASKRRIFEQPGQHKGPMKRPAAAKRPALADKTLTNAGRGEDDDSNGGDNAFLPAPKKRRMSADQRLAMSLSAYT